MILAGIVPLQRQVQITSLLAQHAIAQQVEGEITCCSFVKGVLLDLCSKAVLSNVSLISLFW